MKTDREIPSVILKQGKFESREGKVHGMAKVIQSHGARKVMLEKFKINTYEGVHLALTPPHFVDVLLEEALVDLGELRKKKMDYLIDELTNIDLYSVVTLINLQQRIVLGEAQLLDVKKSS
ncbi:hypothetical protein KW805_01390 [Candidatus Pacearchaeota archaeon]|nr:hypothetical protein [Candidatus Pacearchaeota archaeon]